MWARLAILLLALGAAACAPAAGPPTARLPEALDVLVLADDSDEITPIVYPHAEHALREGSACADCHHTLREDPRALPAKCRSCHPLEPEEGLPPDL